ncbi:hypothetical protein BH18ACT11_BH18ACT11_04430 [soil metagenome]
MKLGECAEGRVTGAHGFAYDSAFHTFEALMSPVYADLVKEMHPDETPP